MTDAPEDLIRLAVLVACYNRVDVTVPNLRALADVLRTISEINFTMFVLDDNSPDGTGEVLAREGSDYVITAGDGTCYWNGGMVRAYLSSLAAGPHDAYLLFNDDVEPSASGVRAAIYAYLAELDKVPAIVVGMTEDRDGRITYGGVSDGGRWTGLSSLRLIPRAEIGTQATATFNANFVLFPGRDFRSLGGLDPKYCHAYGDFDLGLRASRTGIPIMVSQDTVGLCSHGVRFADRRRTKRRVTTFVRLVREPNGLLSYLRFVSTHRALPLLPVFALNRVFVLLRESGFLNRSTR